MVGMVEGGVEGTRDGGALGSDRYVVGRAIRDAFEAARDDEPDPWSALAVAFARAVDSRGVASEGTAPVDFGAAAGDMGREAHVAVTSSKTWEETADLFAASLAAYRSHLTPVERLDLLGGYHMLSTRDGRGVPFFRIHDPAGHWIGGYLAVEDARAFARAHAPDGQRGQPGSSPGSATASDG